MKLNETLKPCPFCGNEVKAITKSNGYSACRHTISWAIECSNCKIESKHFEDEFYRMDSGEFNFTKDGLKQAVENWNKRA